MFSVLVNRCLIAGIVIDYITCYRARCIETNENSFRIFCRACAIENGTRRIAICGWNRIFYDSYLLNSCHTNTFSATQPQFSFDKYLHTVCLTEKRQNSRYYIFATQSIDFDCVENVFQ